MKTIFDTSTHQITGIANWSPGKYTWHCSCGAHARKQWPTEAVARAKWERGHLKTFEEYHRWMNNGMKFAPEITPTSEHDV